MKWAHVGKGGGMWVEKCHKEREDWFRDRMGGELEKYEINKIMWKLCVL